jgi:hypothetical protein
MLYRGINYCLGMALFSACCIYPGLPALMKGAKENVYVGGDHALASQRLLFAQASLENELN